MTLHALIPLAVVLGSLPPGNAISVASTIGVILAGAPWVIGVLIASSLLAAAFLLPIFYDAWFREPEARWAPSRNRFEVGLCLLVPTLVTAAASLAVGPFAGMPSTLAELMADRELHP